LTTRWKSSPGISGGILLKVGDEISPCLLTGFTGFLGKSAVGMPDYVFDSAVGTIVSSCEAVSSSKPKVVMEVRKPLINISIDFVMESEDLANQQYK
jgi:hypothetical protein